MKPISAFSAFLALALLASLAVFSPARAECSGKLNFPSGAVIYYGLDNFSNAHYTDTVRFASDRNFLDTAYYDVAAFVSPLDCTGILRASVINDSALAVVSSVDTDSTKYYYYLIFYKPK